MTQLDDHIERVEKYGFERRNFPISYNGHTISIISNDAYIEDQRLLFDFTLYCNDCYAENGISGRFPANYNDQMAGVVSAKIAVFETFKYNECV